MGRTTQRGFKYRTNSAYGTKGGQLLDEGFDVKFSTNKYLKQNLEESAQGAYQENLFGLGWEVSLKMPGDIDIERIPLVEFNTRALVHSTQHGQGNWLQRKQRFLGR